MKPGVLVAAAVIALVVPAVPAAAKQTLSCYEEPGTNKTSCVDVANVEVNGEIRSSAYYNGGPKGVRQTPYFFVVDCKKRIATLQDADGSNFGGNVADATPHAKTLWWAVCGAKPSKQNSKLRQF